MKSFYLVILWFLGCLQTSAAQSGCSYWSTFLGNPNSDDIKSVTRDNSGNYYIIMQTNSPFLPTTPNKISDTLVGFYDAYLAKFDSCGAFIWGTYLGTSAFDSGERIAFCKDGNIAFCGYTQGTGLPITAGAFQATNNGQSDAFIGKIKPNGQLIWLSYFGANGSDLGYEIACDTLGNIILGGTSTSNALYTNSASFQQTMGGNTDAFIARFSANGQLKWSTFFGGVGSEDIHAIVTDKFGNIIGSGGTFSFNLNTSLGCHQNTKGNGMDGYIIKLDSNGTRIFSTYFGANAQDDAYGLATDNNANIYVSGLTASSDFSTTLGAYQLQVNGLADTYLARFTPTGSLTYCTLLGGSDYDFINKMTYHNGHLYLIGYTSSTDFPMIGGSVYNTLLGAANILLIKYAVNGTPVTTSYFGGNSSEAGNDIVATGSKICFVGKSGSTNYPTSWGTWQVTNNGNDDGVITQMVFPPQVLITSIETQVAENFPDKMVYPNPCKEFIYLPANAKDGISLTDVLGRYIDTKPLLIEENKTLKLNTTLLRSGLYFIRFKNTSTLFVKEE